MIFFILMPLSNQLLRHPRVKPSPAVLKGHSPLKEGPPPAIVLRVDVSSSKAHWCPKRVQQIQQHILRGTSSALFVLVEVMIWEKNYFQTIAINKT